MIVVFDEIAIFANSQAGVVELVDTLDLGSSASRRESSSLSARTIKKIRNKISSYRLYKTHRKFYISNRVQTIILYRFNTGYF